VRDAICRKPPGIKRFREGWDLYNKQLCLYFRVHALLVMINRVVGCNIACTLVSQEAAEEIGILWSPVLHTEVSLYHIMVWRTLCAVGSTQSAWRSCTAITRTRGIEQGHTSPWTYYIRKLPNGVIFAYIFSVYSNSCKTTAHGRTVRGSNPGWGEIFCTCPDRPRSPPSLLYNWYRVFPRG
jgi:hypothetical protein